MSYCQDCGAAVKAGDAFCAGCGVGLDSPADLAESPSHEIPDTQPQKRSTEREDGGFLGRATPTSKKTAVSGLVFGLSIGFLLLWGLAETNAGALGFLSGFVLGTLYLWSRPTTHHTVASGLFITAVVLVFVPILFYIPVIAGAETDTATGAGEQLGGILGLFIWTVVFFIIAIVIAAVGRAVKNRAPESV